VAAGVVDRMEGGQVTLFDFTDPSADLSSWVESSDTAREVGKSKGAFVLQKTQLFQRAVFFGLLNPQDSGACFVGFNRTMALNLSPTSSITIKSRGQGKCTSFKIALKHHGDISSLTPSYEYFFQAPTGDELSVLEFPLTEFLPYIRGKLQNDSEPLDTSDITSFGIQLYGGVYEDVKQSGPATLEIDWIKVSN